MGRLRPIAVGLGAVYLFAIATLGPLLGSTADSTAAFAEHYQRDSNLRADLFASLALLAVAALLVWAVIVIRTATRPHGRTHLDELVGAASIVSASGLLVAAGLLATVPVSTLIGKVTDDPGIEPAVAAGIAQAGTIVLIVTMLAVGATAVMAAHLGHAAGSLGRWVVVTAWLVAASLVLGISIALLFPFGFWAIALGFAWKDSPPDGV